MEPKRCASCNTLCAPAEVGPAKAAGAAVVVLAPCPRCDVPRCANEACGLPVAELFTRAPAACATCGAAQPFPGRAV